MARRLVGEIQCLKNVETEYESVISFFYLGFLHTRLAFGYTFVCFGFSSGYIHSGS